jgi:ABC-type glycerol-3-phosphate transport system substrate-binding protein
MKGVSIFQIVLLSVFGAFAVAGVLIFAIASTSGGGGGIGNVEIWGTLDEEAMAETLRAIQDVNPDMLGVRYVYKDPDTFISEFTNALANGAGPDMVILRNDQMLMQQPRLIPISYERMSAQEFTSLYADAGEMFMTPQGIYGVPFMIDPLVLYWNRDMLSTAGYAQAPTYWDEVQDMAQKISQRTESGAVTRSAVSLGQFRNVNNAKSIMSMLILQSEGGIVDRNEEGQLESTISTLNTAVSQTSIAALRFYTSFADPSRPGYSWNASLPEARTSFTAQNLALYYGLASERSFIAAANPNLNFSMASTTQRRASRTAINAGYTYAFAFPRTSKNPEGALTVAFLMNSLDNGKLFSNALKMPSAARAVLQSRFGNEIDFLNRQAINVRLWPDPNPAKTDDIFRAMIEDTVSGSMLIGEAIQRADQQLNVVLEEYRQTVPEPEQQ